MTPAGIRPGLSALRGGQHLRCPFVAFPLRMTEGFTFSISQYGTHRFTVRSYRGGPSRGRAGPCARTRDFAFWILIFPAPVSFTYRYFDNRIPRDGHSYRTRYRARHGHNASELRSSMCCSQPMVIFYSTHPRYHRYAVISSCSHGSIYASTGQFALSKIRVAYV